MLHGKQLRLIRKTGRYQKPQFCVEVRDGLCRDLPAWMFDASLCAGMVVGPPQVSLAALKELRTVLDGGSGSSARSWRCLEKEGTSDEPTDEKQPQAIATPAGVRVHALAEIEHAKWHLWNGSPTAEL